MSCYLVDILQVVVVFVLGYTGYRVYHALYVSPLRNIPGSLLCRLTKRHLEQATVRGHMAQFGLRGMHTYGSVFVCQPDAVCISDAADIRRVLSSPAFTKSAYYRILRFTGIDSLMSTRDPHHVSQKRRVLGPYFSTSYLGKMEHLVIEHGSRAICRRWDEMLGQSAGTIRVNYCSTFSLCTLNVIARLVYGQELGALDAGAPESTLQWMSESTTYISVRALLQLLPRWLFRAVTWPWEHRYRRIADHVHASIRTRAELLGAGHAPPADLLQALLDCCGGSEPARVRLDARQVHAEALLLLIGGIDPTAFTLTWTVHLLMLYPQCYRRAVDEVRAQFPGGGADAAQITYAQARLRLPYLEACIYECMRLVPVPQLMVPRVVPAPGAAVAGHALPAGTTVFANVLGAHLDPRQWPDPHRFDPTRFLDPATRRAAIHGVFTFGYGTRICMGKHLAWLNMLTIMANLLRRYDFRLPRAYTRTGPAVLDPATGHPRIMPMSPFISAKPADQDADCWLEVSAAR
ncbi:hypothetical protein IWW52_003942 [Coemansia sp. RSA 2704]|nr:hypothetical protein IWW52_003942 [Coemansia sp. RSA 2704]